MRVEALRLMRMLRTFRPRLIGSTLTGHVRKGSDIDIHVFADSVESIAASLELEGLVFDVERKQIRKQGEERVYTHIHVQDRYKFELTVYAENMAHYPFRSSITGKPIERASIAELEALLSREYPTCKSTSFGRGGAAHRSVSDLSHVAAAAGAGEAKSQVASEGDALYHSLQVFDLASRELPYDEEFLLAALLHDVGKGIDPHDHVGAALEALEGYITPRTAWLIEHHMEAHALHDGTLGARSRRRLEESAPYDLEELKLLSRCDRQGRLRGVEAPELDEALEYIRELAKSCRRLRPQ